MGSRRRAQSPSSVNKTSQWRLACVFRHAHSAPRCGYKGERVQTHNSFSLRSRALQSLECLQSKTYSVGVTARQRRLLSSAAFFITFCPGGPLLSPPHHRLQPLCLLVAEGTLLLPPPPLQLGHNSSLHKGRSMELAAGKRRSPPPPLPSLWSARAGGVPGTGDPVPLDPALQEMAIAPLLPPEEGRVENFCSAPGPVAPKTS